MSEPMSAGEIEDVLSSIRRLVSEELRPMARAPKAEADSKLMLTPALRVVTADKGIERPSEDQARSAFGTETSSDRLPDFAPEADVAAPFWAGEADEESDVTQIEGFVFQARQSARMAEVAENLPPTEAVQDIVPVEPVAIDGEVMDEIAPPQPTPAAWAQEAPMDDPAAPEAAFAPAPEEGLPEADPDWIRQAEAEVMASLSAQTADLGAGADGAGTTGTEGSLFAHDMQFDEAVLRDLVRDLIREELQGALGERITRNVRKLVRVEVARALTLHDLE